MNFSGTEFFSFFVVSYLADIGNVSSGNYNPLQWACFIFGVTLNFIILVNLLIALMGDTYDRVQEGRDVADHKELANMVLEVEIAAVWRRHLRSNKRLHVCQEVETKSASSDWLGKVREIKVIISHVKQNQAKIAEANTKLITDNMLVREQLSRVENVLGGIREKMIDPTDISSNDVLCQNGHRLIYEYLQDQKLTCNKCNKITEVGYHCTICIYSLCKSCYKGVYKQKLVNVDVTCYRFHQLTWISDHSNYQGYDKKVFSCVSCKKSLFKDSFNCKKCKWDICFKCITIICTKISGAWMKTCKENHSLEWNSRPHSENYRCNVCSGSFQKSGAFRCEPCDYDVCVRCFDDLD